MNSFNNKKINIMEKLIPIGPAFFAPFSFVQMVLAISFLMFFIGLPVSIVYHQYYKESSE